jgi:hypothetical protein
MGSFTAKSDGLKKRVPPKRFTLLMTRGFFAKPTPQKGWSQSLWKKKKDRAFSRINSAAYAV